jgi:hypothetical protein
MVVDKHIGHQGFYVVFFLPFIVFDLRIYSFTIHNAGERGAAPKTQSAKRVNTHSPYGAINVLGFHNPQQCGRTKFAPTKTMRASGALPLRKCSAAGIVRQELLIKEILQKNGHH